VFISSISLFSDLHSSFYLSTPGNSHRGGHSLVTNRSDRGWCVLHAANLPHKWESRSGIFEQWKKADLNILEEIQHLFLYV